MIKQGSLKKRISKLNKLKAKWGVLCIDEDKELKADRAPKRNSQLEFLKWMRWRGAHVWFFDLDFFGKVVPTHEDLRKAAFKSKQDVIEKTRENCFAMTGLHDKLKAHNINKLVVMGRYMNSCVRTTICGDNEGTGGAIAEDYLEHVLSCNKLVHGEGGEWINKVKSDKFEFYTQL